MGMPVERALTSLSLDSPLVEGNHNRKERRIKKVHKLVFIE